jgi:predicted peroxiredoxin
MSKVAITVNGSAPPNIFPPMILGSSAAASGDDVTIFCCPGGAPTMVKGELEKISGKGLPNIVELYDGIRSLGGKILVCELALENKDLKPADFREGVEIVGATSFMASISDANITFSF